MNKLDALVKMLESEKSDDGSPMVKGEAGKCCSCGAPCSRCSDDDVDDDDTDEG